MKSTLRQRLNADFSRRVIGGICLLIAASGAAALEGVGYGATLDDAKQRAAVDLVGAIQVQVKSEVVSCIQTSGKKAEDCGSRVMNRTAADLPMLGLVFVSVPGGSDRFGAKAVLDAQAALPLYRHKLADLQGELRAARKSLEDEKDGRRRHDSLTRQLAIVRAMVDHRLVAVALGDKPEESAITESAILAELVAVEQTVDSISLASRMLLKEVNGRVVSIDPILGAGSNEVTPFAEALRKALMAEGAGKGGDPLTGKADYRILDDGRIDLFLELRRLPDGTLAAATKARLAANGYGEFRATPLAPDFDKLLKDGAVYSADLRVDVSTDRGTRDLLFRHGETVRLVVRTNRSAYFYVVGHVVRPDTQFSYLLPLDGDAAGEKRPERFTKYVPADGVNHYIDLGEFEVVPPFGIEHIMVTASTEKVDASLPKTRFNTASGYFEIVGSAGNALNGLSKTRGLQPKKIGRVMVTEGQLTFTTMPSQ